MFRFPHSRAVLAAASCFLLMLCVVGQAQAASKEGRTPGTYVYYNFTSPTVGNIRWKQTINVSPGVANVFWSNQFGFTNGFGGYAGFQTLRSGVGLFLVSIWNTTQSQAGSPGTVCEQFSEGGTGQSCRYNLTPVQGHQYVIDAAPDNAGWWKFTITDATANTSFVLGSILIGAGVPLDTSQFVSWTEYFDWNYQQATCLDEAHSRLIMALPTTSTSSGSVSASWTGTKISTSCASTSAVILEASDAIEENATGNSAGGNITTSAGLCLQAGSSATTVRCVADTMTQNWVRAANGSLHSNWQCLQPNKTSTGLAQSKCTGKANQVFRLTANQTLKNTSTSLCLSSTGSAGSSVALATCNPTSPAQKWRTPAGFN